MPSLWPASVGLLSGLLLLLIALPIAGLLFAATPRELLAGLADPLVVPALRLSVFTTTVSLLVVLACGTPLAWVIAHRTGRAWRIAGDDRRAARRPSARGGRGGVAAGLRPPRPARPGASVAAASGSLSRSAAVVLAQTFVAAPFYLQAAVAAFRRLDPDLVLVARTLGASRPRVLAAVAIPVSWPGLAGGAAMSWARALGEFGATLMFAGNMGGRTQTLPLAIYTALESDLRAAQSLSILLVVVAFALLVAIRAGARR